MWFKRTPPPQGITTTKWLFAVFVRFIFWCFPHATLLWFLGGAGSSLVEITYSMWTKSRNLWGIKKHLSSNSAFRVFLGARENSREPKSRLKTRFSCRCIFWKFNEILLFPPHTTLPKRGYFWDTGRLLRTPNRGLELEFPNKIWSSSQKASTAYSNDFFDIILTLFFNEICTHFKEKSVVVYTV